MKGSEGHLAMHGMWRLPWSFRITFMKSVFSPYISLSAWPRRNHSASAVSSRACAELMLLLWYFASHRGLVQNTDYRILGGNDKTIAALRCVDSWQVGLPPRMAIAHYRLMNQGDKATEQGALAKAVSHLLVWSPKTFPTRLAAPDNLELDSLWFTQ